MESKKNRVCEIFGIEHPIISGGMVWCSGHELATAVSMAGGLGLIGSGSMYPDVLRTHIRKLKENCTKPYGVNVPLMYPNVEEIMQIIIEESVPIVFTSAGNPKTWTSKLQEHGIKVAHVVSSSKFALKSEEAGVDAVVAEGFEAGGHNGREETSTLCLTPLVAGAVKIPVIAAGGIGSGKAMAAAFCLGAQGVQLGTAFALCRESSAHEAFKAYCLASKEGDSMLLLKKLSPTRMLLNEFAQEVIALENRGAEKEELLSLLGRGRSKKGIFQGDLQEGELEIGQVAYSLEGDYTAADLIQRLLSEYQTAVATLPHL